MSSTTSADPRRRSATSTPPKSRAKRTGTFPMGFLYALIALCVCIAWFAPLQQAFVKNVWPPAKKGPRDAFEFMALAYKDDASEEPSAVDNIHAHLDALTANGYSPISLADALGLLRNGTPVPRNAVLVTLDSHHQSTAAKVKRMLREYGWNAVIFVDTYPIEHKHDDAISWQQLKTMSESDYWTVSLMGHQGAQTIPVDADATMGNYLTSLQWIENAARPETLAELQSRVVQDHTTARALMQKHIGVNPFAYAYPFGDFGQQQHPDDYAGRVNLAAASSLYDLAFTSGQIGLNSMFSEPTRLNRMHVDPNWSATDLINAINMHKTRIGMVQDTDLAQHRPGWVADWGSLSCTETGIRVAATQQTQGGRAWIAGSDLRKDFSTSINFVTQAGDTVVYLRASSDDSSYIQLQLAQSGDVSIRQKVSWETPIVTLANAKAPIRTGKPHQLDLFVRGNYFDALLDGISIFDHSILLNGVADAGLIGIGTSAHDTGIASVTISKATVNSRKSTLVSWTLTEAYEPYVMDWLHNHAGRLTELSPPWDQVQADHAKFISSDNISVYRRLTKMYDLRLTPRVDIENDNDFKSWSPAKLVQRVNDCDCDGLYVNFEKHSSLRVERLEHWLLQTSKMLSGYGRPLLVRLPPMLERLAAVNSLVAVIPAVEIVTGVGVNLPLGSVRAQTIEEEVIAQPMGKALQALPVAFAIADNPIESEASTIDTRVRTLRDAAEAAFHRGAYEKAIATFSEWHQLDPKTPRPLSRIGDALISLGYHDEAVGFFRQSLNLDPGQVDLAVRQARLLTNLNRKESAKDLLNSYARLFPDNIDILFAQAEWLYKQDRSAEAQTRIERILSLDSNNFDASLFLLRLASDETARTRAVDRLMALSTTPERHYDLANAVWQYDLLTLPDSHLLVTMLEDIASRNKDPRVQAIVNKLRPRTDLITEVFNATNGLSEAWHIEGASASVSDSQLTIRANPSREEFTVRLLRSERWRDSFIEADITDVEGGFWLYTRRSSNHLIRFGFDSGEDRIYLQAWKGRNNEIVLNQFIPWAKPSGKTTIRLEVRGNGIVASIDGKEAFDVPLAMPSDFGLGWAAFSVHSRERGEGSVTLSRLQSGPLPVRLALLPPAPAVQNANEELTKLQQQLGSVTDFSPDWFAIDDSGSWSSQSSVDDDFFRLYSRYYRIRLVPTVRVASGAEVLPEDILTVTRTHNFDGLVLLFESMPEEAWFERMDRELGSPGLDLLAVAFDDLSKEGSMRGIAASRTLFQGAGIIEDVPVVDCQDPEADPTENKTGRAILLF